MGSGFNKPTKMKTEIEVEKIEKVVSSWRNTDKHDCPKCGAKLGMPDYKCIPCNVQLKLRVKM